MNLDCCHENIELLREELNRLIEENVDFEEIYRVSVELDEYIVLAMKHSG